MSAGEFLPPTAEQTIGYLEAEVERLRAELDLSRSDHAETLAKWRVVVADDQRHRETTAMFKRQRDVLQEKVDALATAASEACQQRDVVAEVLEETLVHLRAVCFAPPGTPVAAFTGVARTLCITEAALKLAGRLK